MNGSSAPNERASRGARGGGAGLATCGWRWGEKGIWPNAIPREVEPRQLAGSCWNARTSCAHRQATAIFAAHSSAASREGNSSTV